MIKILKKGKMKKIKLIGTNQNEVNLYALDFYTIGHVIFGHITHIILFFLAFMWEYKEMNEHSLCIVAIIGIIWELIENNILTMSPFKLRQDSLNNSLMDIMCVILGGIMSAITLFYFFESEVLLLICVLELMVEFLLFYIFGSMTYNNQKEKHL